MPDWLAAADALVHSTGGLTVLEALMRGCPRDLLRLGPRSRPDQQPRVQALRARPGRGHPGCAARRRRDRARVGTHRDRLLGSTVCGLVRPRRGRTASARDGACGLTEPSPLSGSARSPSGALPPLRPSPRRSRRWFGIPLRLPGRGLALTFDDGPHPEGTPAVLGRARPRGSPRDLLPRRRAGRAPVPRARGGDRRRRSRDRDPRLPAHAAAPPHARPLYATISTAPGP